MTCEASGITASGKHTQFKIFLQINLIMTVQAYTEILLNLSTVFKSVLEPTDFYDLFNYYLSMTRLLN